MARSLYFYRASSLSVAHKRALILKAIMPCKDIAVWPREINWRYDRDRGLD